MSEFEATVDNVTPEAGQQQDTQPGHQQQPAQPAGNDGAQAQFSAIKERMADGTATLADRRQFKELREYLYFDGETPQHMRQQTETDPDAPYDSESEALKGVYEPAQSPDDYRMPHKGNVPEGFTAQDVSDLKALAFELKLPVDTGSTVIDRVYRHLEGVEGGRLAALSEAEGQEYMAEAGRYFKGDQQKLAETAEKAENYLRQTLTPELLEAVKKSFFGTSINYDPVVLTKLAALHDARGMKKK